MSAEEECSEASSLPNLLCGKESREQANQIVTDEAVYGSVNH
jgi:hypothetical protein